MILGVARQSPVRPLAWSAANVGTPASLVETVLKSLTIPADFFNMNGKRIRAIFWGFYGATANSKTIRVRLGPVTLTGTILFTKAFAFNNFGWVVYVDIVRRTVDSQTGFSRFNSEGTATPAQLLDIQEVAAANDDAAAMLLELTGENGAAVANDLVCSGHAIEAYDPP